MPTTKFQKLIYSLITVIITVHLFVFYNLSFVEGLTLAEINKYGIPVFGTSSPLWKIVLIEFVCAFCIAVFIGNPCATKLALSVVKPSENKAFVLETAITCATVCIICPIMSLIAAIIYGLTETNSLCSFISLWLRTIMHNFPLAFFSQIFFIQPFVKICFRALFKKQLVNANI